MMTPEQQEVKRFNDSMENDIQWPKPLGEILKEDGITIDEETRKRNFEDGIRHIQGWLSKISVVK